MPHDVFISYSSANSAEAQAICEGLETSGVTCWIAPRNILAGADWAASIIGGLNDCRAMLLLLSAQSNTSPQVANEVERAAHKRLPILTVRLEDLVLSSHLEYFLSSRHWLEACVPPLALHLPTIVETVQKVLSASSSGQASASELTSLSPAVPSTRQEPRLSALPGGTVTFLFTDIEGSARLWEHYPDAMKLTLARHDALIAASIEQFEGILIKSKGEGDSAFAVFSRATDAVAAVDAIQRQLHQESWSPQTPLHVRIALHTGEAALRDGDYFGSVVNRCARLRALAHGGQALLSRATFELVRDALPADVRLDFLGAHRLKDLQRSEDVYQLSHPDLPTDFPPLRSLDNLPNNLPIQTTSFIGRNREMAEIKRLLEVTPLVTLTGSGGSGKTRLALQIAAELADQYADGAWLVELAPLTDPATVPEALASALSVVADEKQPLQQALTAFLRPRNLLLVLDNCEHLLAACAQLLNTLLHACPDLRVLASSREGLGVSGEQIYSVPSLTLPNPDHLPSVESLDQYEAVQLFIARAILNKADFAVTNANAPAVAQVCHRLDGIPLAIELAAARTKALSIEQIAARMDDRFRLLTGGSRVVLPRLQTLRAAIDWSYDLLTDPERVLLCRLSVFAGGWTLEGAEKVGMDEPIEAWEVLDLMTSLVDKSLVVMEVQSDTARYHLLETVRQYARDRLLDRGIRESDLARIRHRDFYLVLTEEANSHRVSPDQQVWLERLNIEYSNLRLALQFCLEAGKTDDELNSAHGEAALRMCAEMEWFWGTRGHKSEGLRWCTEALALPTAQQPTATRAKVLDLAGNMALWEGDYVQVGRLFEDKLAIMKELGDRQGISQSLTSLAMMYYNPSCYLVR
jgi:predicted ATPase/class 3 adenylate cyclase